MTNGHPRLVHSPAGGKWGSMVEIADDPELDRVLAELDPDAAVAKQSCDDGSASALPAKAATKTKSRGRASKRVMPAMIRAPDGSSFGSCDNCGKRCPAAMLPQYGGSGHECDELDPAARLKELHAKQMAKKSAEADRFEAAKQAARRELAGREASKPKSAYQHFCNSRRVDLKDEKPDLDGKEMTTILADEWGQLTADAKVKFEALAAVDKEIFEKRMAECAVGAAEGKATEAKATEEGGAQDEPKQRYKKARSAYLFYVDRNRARVKEDNPEFQMIEVTKALAVEWNALDAEAKAEYVALHQAEKQELTDNPVVLEPKAPKGAKRVKGAAKAQPSKRKAKSAAPAAAARKPRKAARVVEDDDDDDDDGDDKAEKDEAAEASDGNDSNSEQGDDDSDDDDENAAGAGEKDAGDDDE